MKLFFREMKSPVGRLKIVGTDAALVAVLWEKEKEGRVRLEKLEKSARHSLLLEAEKQLKEYFSGTRKEFDLPLEALGTPFQKKVWEALKRIPFGKTQSYSQLAQKIGAPKASRAVGAAIGRNPISIIVPCHRVIGKSGKLTGFAGGLEAKEILLKTENIGDQLSPVH